MRRLFPFFALLAGLALVGCQDKATTTTTTAGTTTVTKQAHKHGAWWCREHGIPEHECLMCLHGEDEMKKKGDWCETHEYVKSQCFACNPKLRERYAALYRDKYGKEPPEADENPGKVEQPAKGKDAPANKGTN
jgi:hypothetical protein